MSFPADADLPLVALLRRREVAEQDVARPEAVFERAEAHGLAGVLRESWTEAGHPVPASLEPGLAARALARELDHEAHLALLERVDAVLAEAGVPAVVLKGPLFAERFYPHPAARGTSDVDLLVEEARFDAAVAALGGLGYELDDDAHAAWSRREHHHVVLSHPHALPLELHFRAYRGFGETLRAEPLVARARRAGERFRALRVLAPEDELVYLAVHAAAHRFGRLAWLYDIALLVETMPPEAIVAAELRAREWGYSRALAMAGALLVDVLGVDVDRARLLGRLGTVRARVLRAVVGEPTSPALRSATRFAYTMLLSDSFARSMRYAKSASLRHLGRITRRER